MKLAVSVLVILTIIGATLAARPHSGSCTYIIIRPDSLLVASFVPPCNPNERPSSDTIQTWRIVSRVRSCIGHVMIDPTAGEAHSMWEKCDNEGGIFRRVGILASPEGS